MRCALLFSVLFVAACSDYDANRITVTDEFDQAPSNQVDILWIIDDSTSMKEEQAAVKAAAAAFLYELENEDMDFHLGLITTDGDSTNAKAGVLLGTPPYVTSACRDDGDDSDCTYATDFGVRFEQGTEGSALEKGLEVALRAITVPLSQTYNAGFIRPGALLMLIQFTDENDCSDGGRLGASATGEDCYSRSEVLTPVTDLVRNIRDAKEADGGNVVMSGIIGPEASENCDFAVTGQRYRTAIQMLGGVEGDICLADYSAVMQSLGLAATGIKTTFQLEYAADPDEITVTVTPPDGVAIDIPADDVNGYTYLEDYAQIQFNGESVPVREAKITVTYFKTGPVPTPSETEPVDTGTAP